MRFWELHHKSDGFFLFFSDEKYKRENSMFPFNRSAVITHVITHVWMWELDYKESWAPKNWCFWTVVLEKTLESLLDCKEIKSVHPKGDQSWIFIGRTDAEAETPILWPPDWRTESFEKTLMLGKIEGGRKRGRQRMKWLDGITASIAWFWLSSGSWCWTGKPGVLQSMGSQRAGHDWETELNYLENFKSSHS